jgi:hypothetical protein
MLILFVTPDLTDASVTERRLQRQAAGVRVDGCATPDQARARIVTGLHDAVVVDVSTFGESGYQLIAECRARSPRQTVVALTRTAGEDDVAMAGVAGATTSVAKLGNWLEPLVEALAGLRTADSVNAAAAGGAVTLLAPAPPARAEVEIQRRGPATLAEAPPPAELVAQVDQLRHALEQEAAIRRDAEARARNLAAAHDADRQRWQLALKQLEERYSAITQQQAQRSDLESAFESVEQRYLVLLEERRQDLRRLEVLEEQALRQRETNERLESERGRLASETSAAREALAQSEAERERLIAANSGLERQRAELETQLAQATDGLRQAAEHASAIQSALARAEREQQDTLAQLEALRRRVDADGQTLGDREARVRQLERAVETAVADARDVRAELDERHQEFEEARGVARALTESLQAARERAEDAERARETLEASLTAELASVRRDLEERAAAAAEAERARDEAAGREQQVAAELSAVRANAQEVSNELASTRAALETLAAERTALENQLREASQAGPVLAELGLVGLATTTLDGELIRATDAFARVCGLESASALLAADRGQQLPFVLDRGALATRLRGAVGPVRYEARLLHPGGRSRWVLAAALPPAAGDEPTGTVDWVAYDITDTSLARLQQRQIHRLDIACGLASTAGASLLGDGGAALQPGAAILRQIVAYARAQTRPAELTDLADVLSSLGPTIGRFLGASIDTDVRPVAGPLLAEIGRAEAEHLLVGAALAIRDALPLGGVVIVTAGAFDADAVEAEAPTLTPTARVAFNAAGHGVRAVPAPASLLEDASLSGGLVRTAHDPAADTRIEIELPMVVALRPTWSDPHRVSLESRSSES